MSLILKRGGGRDPCRLCVESSSLNGGGREKKSFEFPYFRVRSSSEWVWNHSFLLCALHIYSAAMQTTFAVPEKTPKRNK